MRSVKGILKDVNFWCVFFVLKTIKSYYYMLKLVVILQLFYYLNVNINVCLNIIHMSNLLYKLYIFNVFFSFCKLLTFY